MTTCLMFRLFFAGHLKDVCKDPTKSGFSVPRVRDLQVPWTFIFIFRGILGILDYVASTLSWDPRYLESQTEKI